MKTTDKECKKPYNIGDKEGANLVLYATHKAGNAIKLKRCPT